jgi:hypothetical protein
MQGPVSTSELHNLLELSVKIASVIEQVESFFNFRLPKPLSFEVQASSSEACVEGPGSTRPAYPRVRGSTEPILSFSMNHQRAIDGWEVPVVGSSPLIHSNSTTSVTNPTMTRAEASNIQPIRGATSAAVFTSQPTSVPGGSGAKNTAASTSSNSSSMSRPRKNSSAAELVSILDGQF